MLTADLARRADERMPGWGLARRLREAGETLPVLRCLEFIHYHGATNVRHVA